MKKRLNSPFMLFLIVTALIFTLLWSMPAFAKHHQKKFKHNPIIFVHGGAGSASQFESQAMRFTSNGYPQDHLYVLEYDSRSVSTGGYAFIATVHLKLDALITKVLATTGKSQVDLMGHSLGTLVSQLYLTSSPVRAARIAHWVNIDGYSAAEQPGGVDTLGLWAGIGDGGYIVGGQNITMDNQTHVQTATSAESFFEIFKFLTSKAPKTTMIIPKRRYRHIKVAGRACYFPENTGVDGSILEIYKVSAYSGKRLCKKPKAVFAIGEDGNWGPFNARVGERYEFVIVREGQDHHIYKEAFLRDDYFVRLQTSAVGGGVGANMDTAPGQSNLVVTRDKEFWGERLLENDILAVNGVNVVTATNSPFINRTTAIYLFDLDSDGQSFIDEPIPYFHSLYFMTGVDLFMPASNPPDNRIRLTMIPRGQNGLIQEINIPNWSSDGHRISVLFNDFVQWDTIR